MYVIVASCRRNDIARQNRMCKDIADLFVFAVGLVKSHVLHHRVGAPPLERAVHGVLDEKAQGPGTARNA